MRCRCLVGDGSDDVPEQHVRRQGTDAYCDLDPAFRAGSDEDAGHARKHEQPELLRAPMADWLRRSARDEEGRLPV